MAEMTTKQKEALQKAQAAAKAKREAEKVNAKVANCVDEAPAFDNVAAFTELSKRIDNLTNIMLEIRDALKAKGDLSFLHKFK